ncbi:MAG TPA: leucyl aminopeptidase family protein [Streptosporangiaceae bacterium]|nr:leucyl aminopeptidase family protein [Streptosporangiaceae bacterium]
MPIDIPVGLTPADGQPLAGGFLAALATGDVPVPDLFAVPVGPDDLSGGRPELDPYLPAGGAATLIAAAELSGRPGESADAALGIGAARTRLLLLGVGDQSPAALRRAGSVLGRRAAHGKTIVTTAASALPGPAAQALTEGILLGGYTYSLKSGNGASGPGQVQLLAPAGAAAAGGPLSAAVDRAQVIARAVALARDLTNTPSAVKGPAWLAAQAEQAAAAAGLGCRIWDEDELAADGFGGLLAVGSGSARPPRLIELSYRPDGAQAHIVLAGKGITFDSGGLSLKPNDGMKLMKTDMAGGAVVIAVLSALAALGVTARVTGLVAAAENLPSGSAYRPGDVITHYGGRTVEVLNTDAEGRLVLADALAYADAVHQPDALVDIATLTGAARVALGTSLGALYATDDTVAAGLLAAGQASGDRLWRMPLVQDYTDALDSPVADLAHVARPGTAGSYAGSIAAALFLREFSGGRPWAHLDVAGAARVGSDDGEITRGATGFGTRLLLRWLTDRAG